MDPTQAPAAPDSGFGFASVLSGAWDTALRTFNTWVDHEFGAELAIAAEAEQAERQITFEQAPASSGFLGDVQGAQLFGVPVLWIAGGAAAVLVLFLFLRR